LKPADADEVRPAIEPQEEGDPCQRLSRWENAGGLWRVMSRSQRGITIAMCSCEGQEMARFSSTDADLIAFVGDRTTNED
jgi:hypothetical protein